MRKSITTSISKIEQNALFTCFKVINYLSYYINNYNEYAFIHRMHGIRI